MNIGQAILLGIVQGLTEFLPVSSSGHLVLGQTLLNVREPGIAFEVFTHLATLLAVLVAFRRDIYSMMRSFFALLRPWPSFREDYRRDANIRLLVYIVIATIPAVVVGLFFKDRIEAAFEDPHQTAINLIVTGVILFLTLFIRRPVRPLSIANTFLMGLAQALAIMPGISRSGSTISVGLYSGVEGEEAARFSFLLSIPAILGAAIIEGRELLQVGIQGGQAVTLLFGAIMAFISGYLAIRFMLKILRRGKLYWFAPYCILLGIIGLYLI
ncbi:undecaprenyl-diphosphatase UppP [candidate division KSB1 bacterium]|nr:undecaprenyl-diphosphatase UppP [candidate division KSB1 bacterium]